jgi:hypothetical protein
MTTGHCLCGVVRYEIDGPFRSLLHCHCSMCRKHHGTAFATWAVAPVAGFRITAGADAIERYASSPGMHRSFCRHCGSVVPERNEAFGVVIAPAGNLEGDLGLEPQFHMFTASKAAWYQIEDDLPQHAEWPPELGLQPAPRPPIATRPGVVAGSCLCGATAYEIDGQPLRFYFCHCSRCRLGRIAAHATNVFFKADGFRWIRGAEWVRDYHVPGAQFFGVAFCGRCGSAVPRVSTERNVVNVPAGSLDSEPGMAPQAHIFVGSKAPWDRIAGPLPQFTEMPTRT